jgi:hypothetical protein
MRTSLSLLTVAGATIAAAACVAVPGPDGHYVYYPLPPAASAYAAAPGAPAAAPSQFPAVLQARLYPANEAASQTGVVSGTVTNMMTGKGRFQLLYQGDTLVGEATRVDGDARRGVASAYGAGGAFMSCDYQMHTPRQGAGTCTFSNGAQYKVHIGI